MLIMTSKQRARLLQPYDEPYNLLKSVIVERDAAYRRYYHEMPGNLDGYEKGLAWSKLATFDIVLNLMTNNLWTRYAADVRQLVGLKPFNSQEKP
jgi:hypothetical protein